MRLVGGILLVVVFSHVAHAGGDDAAARNAAREHYHKGSVAYELGHYDTAIREYEAAYQAFNEPTLLYNLGQAHRLANHPVEALHFYRMYLVKVPDASNRADVESKIGALQATLAQAPSSPPKPASTPAGPVAPAPSQQPLPAAKVDAPTPPPATPIAVNDRKQTRGLLVAGIVVDVVGLGLVGGGIGLEVIAKNAGDDIARADADHQPFDPTKYSTYQNDRIAAGVLIGVGAAAVVSGTVMAIVGARRGRVPVAMVAPQLSTTHAGLSAAIRF